MEAADKIDSAVREAAAEWVVRLSGAQVMHSDKSEFAAWLRRSPLHVKAYLRAEAAWLEMDGAAKADVADVAALLREPYANVIPAKAGIQSKNRDSTPIKYRRVATASIAAAVVLGIGLAFAPRLIERLDPNTYATATGEQRRVRLADGSIVELNTRSKIRVHVSSDARDVYLTEGEAFFDVAQDASRPFRVLSDDAVVRAIGTQFNVYRDTQGTLVTVLEGKVAVERRGDAPDRAVVAAGNAVQVVPTAIVRRAVAKPAAAVAWRQHRVVFENETLAAVVAEFNRYNDRQLVVEEPQLAQLRISGVFDPNEPGDLVAFLERLDDARATESDRGILLSPVR